MEIRFAIIPPASINKMSAQLAKKYARQGKHRFVVDNRNFFPHITLLRTKVTKKNYPLLISDVQEALRKFTSFNLHVSGFSVYPGGWLGLNIKSSVKLTSLKKALHIATQKNSSPTSNFAKLKSNHPHITLVRFYKNSLTTDAIVNEQLPKVKFTAHTIGLCKSRQTQVYKIVDQIKLK